MNHKKWKKIIEAAIKIKGIIAVEDGFALGGGNPDPIWRIRFMHSAFYFGEMRKETIEDVIVCIEKMKKFSMRIGTSEKSMDELIQLLRTAE
jgi:hypothetical protein